MANCLVPESLSDAHRCDLRDESSFHRGLYWFCKKCGVPRLMILRNEYYTQRLKIRYEIDRLSKAYHESVKLKMMWFGDDMILSKEEIQMTEEIKQQEALPTWDEIQPGSFEKKPQVKVMGIGKDLGQKVLILSDKPKEIPYTNKKTGLADKFFIFDVSQEGVLKDLPTSSLPLLGALKAYKPLGGKEFLIYKEMDGTIQRFKVEHLNPEEMLMEDVVVEELVA